MVNVRRAFYNVVLAAVALLLAAGCGKPGGPPPGAPQDATAPTIDQGSESGPKDPAAGSSTSTPGADAPASGQGETK